VSNFFARKVSELQETFGAGSPNWYHPKIIPDREYPVLPGFQNSRLFLACLHVLAIVVWAAGGHTAAAAPLSTEFDTPFQVRVLPDATVVEISGSFSWALPQNLEAVLLSAPKVRVVHLESPGGHLLPAMQIASIIRQRGLDTYVGRFCASACTVAFLGGKQRWIAPDARLGFHQASAPGYPPEQANAFLKQLYETFGVPAPFVARVLRIPQIEIWYPKQDELRANHFITDAPPGSVLALGNDPLRRLSDLVRLLPEAPDNTVVEFAAALSGIIGQLQEANPEACWAFAHEGPEDALKALPEAMLDSVAAVRARLAAAAKATQVQTPNLQQRNKTMANLLALIRADGRAASLEGLRAGAEHTTFCPSLHELLRAALDLPDPRRAITLRAVLYGG
jgi:membrane-bound ClpP family serine protease